MRKAHTYQILILISFKINCAKNLFNSEDIEVNMSDILQENITNLWLHVTRRR